MRLLPATAEADTDASRHHDLQHRPKTVELAGSGGWKIGGMVRSSGMIAPQLATMLCASSPPMPRLSPPVRSVTALAVAARHSFNRIDVDGCMSTSDAVLLRRLRCLWHQTDETNSTSWCGAPSLSPPDHRRRRCLHDIRIVTGATSEDAARTVKVVPSPPRTCSVRRLKAAIRTAGPHRRPPWALCA